MRDRPGDRPLAADEEDLRCQLPGHATVDQRYTSHPDGSVHRVEAQGRVAFEGATEVFPDRGFSAKRRTGRIAVVASDEGRRMLDLIGVMGHDGVEIVLVPSRVPGSGEFGGEACI